MIRSAQNTTKRLLVGESGIAMPVSLLVFLFLTFVCMSVFALGEAIRVRTELQYKVDNAAYAAALVQADSLSRIAVLNRALAWTYAQTNNRQVNYIMNRWLSETYETFIRDADAMEKKHIEGSSAACNLHNLAIRRSDRDKPRRHTSSYIDGTDDFCYGLALAGPDIDTIKNAFENALSLQLHGRLCSSGERGIKVLQEEVIDTVPLNEYEAISAQLFAGHKNIINMSKAAEEIKKSMDGRIRQVVQTMLEGTESCVFSTDLSEFLEKNIDESDVLKRYDIQTGGSLRSDAYWQKTWWQKDSDSLAHSYSGEKVPELQWIGYAVSWVCNIHGHTPTSLAFSEERISTPGQHPDKTRWQTENWDKLPEAEIFRLKENFFSKDGAVVVAAKTPIPDLFGVLTVIYGLFQPQEPDTVSPEKQGMKTASFQMKINGTFLWMIGNPCSCP